MDLNDLKPKSQTFIVELKHPRTFEPLVCDDGTKMTWEMYGPYSPEYKEVSAKLGQEKINKQRKNPIQNEILEFESYTLDALSKTTVSLNIQLGGEKVKKDEKIIRKLLEDIPWIRNQLENELAEYVTFTKL